MKKEASDVTLAYVIDGIEYVFDIEAVNVYVDPKTMTPYMMEALEEPQQVQIGPLISKAAVQRQDRLDDIVDKLEQMIDAKIAGALEQSSPQYIYNARTQSWDILPPKNWKKKK